MRNKEDDIHYSISGEDKSVLDIFKANRIIISYLMYFSGENGALTVLKQDKMITPS